MNLQPKSRRLKLAEWPFPQTAPLRRLGVELLAEEWLQWHLRGGHDSRLVDDGGGTGPGGHCGRYGGSGGCFVGLPYYGRSASFIWAVSLSVLRQRVTDAVPVADTKADSQKVRLPSPPSAPPTFHVLAY